MNQRISLITGSSKGMGRGIAQKFYENGYFVYITYLNDKDGAEETAANMDKERYDIVKLDVREEENVKSVMNKIKETFGKLDVLVNNAGVEIPETIEEATLENWNTVTQTKINGVFLCSKHAQPLLEKSKNPNIINITVLSGKIRLINSQLTVQLQRESMHSPKS